MISDVRKDAKKKSKPKARPTFKIRKPTAQLTKEDLAELPDIPRLHSSPYESNTEEVQELFSPTLRKRKGAEKEEKEQSRLQRRSYKGGANRQEKAEIQPAS